MPSNMLEEVFQCLKKVSKKKKSQTVKAFTIFEKVESSLLY